MCLSLVTVGRGEWEGGEKERCTHACLVVLCWVGLAGSAICVSEKSDGVMVVLACVVYLLKVKAHRKVS